MMRHREFEVAELSLSSYVKSLDLDPRPFVALPVYPSRQFRHGGIFVNAADQRPHGIRAHVYIKPRTPRTPRLNGKVERSHRVDAEEFYRLLDGVVIDDINIFNARLKEWQDYYNYDRPHGGLDGQTPYERLRQKTQAEARA
jgi:Integrase core domain